MIKRVFTAVPLETLPTGSRARIVYLQTPGRWSQRLIQMGFIPGEVVEVVLNRGAGPVVVKVMGATVSLGRGIARRIIVEPINKNHKTNPFSL